MVIIIANEQHYSIIQKIAYDTWPHTFGAILSEKQIAYMLKWMYDFDSIKKQVSELGHVFILATENSEYYGYASYEINYNEEPVTKIHKIYILPSAQGKGVGKTMIDHIEKKAKHNNNYSVTLNVNRENRAIQFYEKIGFTKIGEENIDIGEGFLMQDAIMQKQVSK